MASTNTAASVDWQTASPDEVRRLLDVYGLVNPLFAGVQVDVNAVAIRNGEHFVDAHLCDHNCTTSVDGKPTGGGYDCPAAYTVNKGLRMNTQASGEQIVRGVEQVAAGLEKVRHLFFENSFAEYGEQFGIPENVHNELRYYIDRSDLEVALFGGSPEIHPDILMMISNIKAKGHSVHVTMTGRRFLLQPEFVQQILECPPDVIALSADDVEGPEQIERLMNISMEELKAEWSAIPKLFGQRQKVYEAIYTIRLGMQYKEQGFPNLLLNIALHNHNLPHLVELMDAFATHFPQVKLNPFPVQSGFMNVPGPLDQAELALFEAFVDLMIEEHHRKAAGHATRWPIVTRLHFWLLFKSAFDTYRNDVATLSNVVSGANFWTCFNGPGVGRYVQVTSAGNKHATETTAGGALACFWNKSVADRSGHVWDLDQDQIATYLTSGRQEIAAKADAPCTGCGFPRLVFDSISAEIGSHPALRPRYLELRKEHLGF